MVATRLSDLTALRPGLTAERATDILWFYLGHHSWRLCVSDQGWSWEEAERWLAEQVWAAVLGMSAPAWVPRPEPCPESSPAALEAAGTSAARSLGSLRPVLRGPARGAASAGSLPSQ
ncbi:hypothetical protein [Streptomyces sp. NPDC056160]|uniref:hypothetical protein n=1 Tax=Streptomyces sp. NPDC056160 TaxID=3345731 RepID=UPI0035D6DDCC